MIHISNKQINNIYCVSQTGLIKPQGLWYANADEWLIFFAKYNEKIKECKYVYELELNYTKLMNNGSTRSNSAEINKLIIYFCDTFMHAKYTNPIYVHNNLSRLT
jgi:hypothetical protein